MTKSELTKKLAQKANVTYVKADLIVNSICQKMIDSLLEGKRIEIRGFGSFIIKHYKAYQGRNPRTGELIHIAEKKLPFFKAGKELRNKLNAN
ncbi:MAG: integration host factor subunit beta [Bdellovibrionaceae bacterium]|nr:integration host factor subunit beta [Pseudobdellovibrionaceae bacterium]